MYQQISNAIIRSINECNNLKTQPIHQANTLIDNIGMFVTKLRSLLSGVSTPHTLKKLLLNTSSWNNVGVPNYYTIPQPQHATFKNIMKNIEISNGSPDQHFNTINTNLLQLKTQVEDMSHLNKSLDTWIQNLETLCPKTQTD